MTSTAQSRLEAARFRLSVQHPPMGRLALFCDFVLDDQIQFSKLGDRRVVFNPAYLETLSKEVLDHELMRHVLHLGLRHHSRGAERVPLHWAVAAGALVHLLLAKPSPGFSWIQRAVVYSAEEILDQLPWQLPPGPLLPPWTGEVAPEASDAYWARILRELVPTLPFHHRREEPQTNLDWMDWSPELERALDTPLTDLGFELARDLERISDGDPTLAIPADPSVRLPWLTALLPLLDGPLKAHRLARVVAEQADGRWFQLLISQLLPMLRQRGWMSEFATLTSKDALLQQKMKEHGQALSTM